MSTQLVDIILRQIVAFSILFVALIGIFRFSTNVCETLIEEVHREVDQIRNAKDPKSVLFKKSVSSQRKNINNDDGGGDGGIRDSNNHDNDRRQQQQQQQQQQQSIILKLQSTDRDRFQEELDKLQHPPDCSTARILFKPPLSEGYSSDGLGVKLQEMGKMLEVATSTKRTLVISPQWRTFYEPEDCPTTVDPDGSGSSFGGGGGWWRCLWEPVSNCTTNDHDDDDADEFVIAARDDMNDPSLFNYDYYHGTKRIAMAPEWNIRWDNNWHIDTIPRWTRSHGRFWVRSQLAHYLWRPNTRLASDIAARWNPIQQQLSGSSGRGGGGVAENNINEAYIAFHMRIEDDLMMHFANDFGRERSMVKGWERYMNKAMRLREEHPALQLRTIYIATDSDGVIEEIRRRDDEWKLQGWRFLYQDERGGSMAAMGTDLEVMRRADFLVGSYQSNFYRLAAELNLSWNIAKYPLSLDRLLSVDVEWYEDP